MSDMFWRFVIWLANRTQVRDLDKAVERLELNRNHWLHCDNSREHVDSAIKHMKEAQKLMTAKQN